MRGVFAATAVAAMLFFPVPPAGAFFFSDSARSVKAENGIVSVDAADIPAGESRLFRYREGKTEVRFFLVRDGGGKLRAALDACEACRSEGKGYKREKGALRCINCGRTFVLGRIGIVAGGCNPHPLTFALNGEVAAFSAKDLMNCAEYFPENRR
jgi:uncharacterized membrane protein